ncbi:carbohydrate ABC transporter permease [Actinobacteria bacterium YIM 96077]|uniref:Carbohydrate ABC transporter permease n=1 Tax=Phytoactinopolyspora halophila TaxID=1981511 RepID=A0A329QP19_9ACTN|nr:carbohydrate ABC transporter permease [Phytoactinopolyspora halophila]AYY15686.1 carbohydrate ABC transporter permease [Actinobacteria bacterium YIM 96077]RAW14127.1 carbohydrate ABC transporter permease [Phytoactinopolyspora halophila]
MTTGARIRSYLILGFAAAITVVPLIYMGLLSLQTEAETLSADPVLLPEEPQFGNYLELFERAPFGNFILNSAIVTGGITIAHLLFDPLVGYVFAKFQFPLKNILFMLLLATLMVPLFVRMIPLYTMMADLGWLNTYQALITPFLMDAFGIFLMRQFIQPIPDDLIQAARIDGASELRIYARVILPQVKPAMAVLGVFTFVYQWNEFIWPLVATTTEDMRTIPVGLTLFNQEYFTLWHLTAAGSVLLFIPTVVLFLLTQRYFVRGITLSGLK